MVRRGHHLCRTDTLHFLKITPSKTTFHNYQVRGHTSFLVFYLHFINEQNVEKYNFKVFFVVLIL
jgi:hypothetical protein